VNVYMSELKEEWVNAIERHLPSILVEECFSEDAEPLELKDICFSIQALAGHPDVDILIVCHNRRGHAERVAGQIRKHLYRSLRVVVQNGWSEAESDTRDP